MIWYIVIPLLLYLCICFLVAFLIVMPKKKQAIIPNYLAAYKYEDCSFLASDGKNVSAWYFPGKEDKAVVLAAGILRNRVYMAKRALFYLEQGFHVLMIDLRATGESASAFVTFGWRERLDVVAAYDFLLTKNIQKIALHGNSLGAAAICYAYPIFQYTPLFLVLESCYDTLEQATKHRVEKYFLPQIGFLGAPVIFFVEKLARISMPELKPLEYCKEIRCPVLFFFGDSEKVLPMKESMSLVNNCPSKRKFHFVFVGGDHENFIENQAFEKDFLEQLQRFVGDNSSLKTQ